ncbi:MAG: hypothetical protein J1E06_02635 [Acutalibacter sp.]|nr:hypothetical protein [Acutalibacter sp.]
MFFLKETWYQLRKRGVTLLTLVLSVLLLASMALYLGSLRSNETALDNLANVIDVPVKVSDPRGESFVGLQIPSGLYDALSAADVVDLRSTAQAVGAMSKESRAISPDEGGVDTAISAANCWEQFSGLQLERVTFSAGCDKTIFAGTEGKVVVTSRFAKEYNLFPGDSFSLPLFLRNQRGGGSIWYSELGEAELFVAGVLDSVTTGTTATDIYVPTAWLREVTENAGLAFSYNSISAKLKDPLHLNEFKIAMWEQGFREAAIKSNNYTDNVLVISDELFIRTARELQKNISTFQGFLIPFFLLVIFLVALSLFLILRNSRRELAVASSLGRSKIKSGMAQFAAVFLIALLGCCLALPIMLLGGGLSVQISLSVCGLFLLCNAAGTVAALVLLLRFDAMELLTKVD